MRTHNPDARAFVASTTKVGPIEAEPNTPHRSDHFGETLAREAMGGVPGADQRVAPANGKPLAAGVESHGHAGGGVAIEAVHPLHARISDGGRGAGAGAQEEMAAAVGEETLIGLHRLRKGCLRKGSAVGGEVDRQQRVILTSHQQLGAVRMPGHGEGLVAGLDLRASSLGADVPDANGAIATAARKLAVVLRVPGDRGDCSRMAAKLGGVLGLRTVGVPHSNDAVAGSGGDARASLGPAQTANAGGRIRR